MKRSLTLLCCLAIVFVIDVTAAQAIPAFARREGVGCQMCHFRMPELNEDGHAYARRGLREKAPSSTGGAPAAETPLPLGQALAVNWADYLTVMGTHTYDVQTGVKPMFNAGTIDAWAAGPLDQRWSGLGDLAFDIQNGGPTVAQAYGQFDTHWNSSFQSARFGQTLPFAILFNQGGPSMTLSTPVVLSTSSDTGTSWTPTTLLRGMELGAIDMPRWNAYVGAAQPHLDIPPAGSEPNTDICASAEYLIGENGNSVSLYGYSGHAWLSPSATEQPFYRVGFFGNVYWPKTKVVAGYLGGSDKDVSDQSLKNSGYFLLGEHLLSDTWAIYGRYDHMRQDLTAGDSQTIQGPALGLTWWAQTQIRLTLEGQLLKTTGQRDDKLLTAEFMWLF